MRNSIFPRGVSLLLFLVAFAMSMSLPVLGQGRALQTFVLKDDLGQAWNHDLVFFPLAHAPSTGERNNLALLAADGTSVPFQFCDAGTKIAFLADVPRYGESLYRLVRQRQSPAATPWQIERNTDSLRVSNDITGVAVPTAAGDFQHGPILGIMLKSGKWVGGSLLKLPACHYRV